jgi:hypothetical protein
MDGVPNAAPERRGGGQIELAAATALEPARRPDRE